MSDFGQCGRCGRTLKNPDYIAIGFGKICAAKMGIAIPSKKSSQEGQAGSGAIPERKAAVIKRKLFRTLSSSITFVMFFLTIGTVGAMECGAVPLTEGMIRALVIMALWVLFAYLAQRGRANKSENNRKGIKI
jgi:hypothetical protein